MIHVIDPDPPLIIDNGLMSHQLHSSIPDVVYFDIMQVVPQQYTYSLPALKPLVLIDKL